MLSSSGGIEFGFGSFHEYSRNIQYRLLKLPTHVFTLTHEEVIKLFSVILSKGCYIGNMSATKFYNYLELIKKETTYAKRMASLSNQIFGEVSRPTDSKSMKVVRLLEVEPHCNKQEVKNYYPRHVETHKLIMNLRDYGLFRDEHEDFKEEMMRLRELRGKSWKKKEK